MKSTLYKICYAGRNEAARMQPPGDKSGNPSARDFIVLSGAEGHIKSYFTLSYHVHNVHKLLN